MTKTEIRTKPVARIQKKLHTQKNAIFGLVLSPRLNRDISAEKRDFLVDSSLKNR